MILSGYDKVTYQKDEVIEANTPYTTKFKYSGNISQVLKSCTCTSYTVNKNIITVNVEANEFKDPREVLHEQSYQQRKYYYKSIMLNVIMEDKKQYEIKINFKITE